MKKTIRCKYCMKWSHTDKTDICNNCTHAYWKMKLKYQISKDEWLNFKESKLKTYKEYAKIIHTK